MNFVQQQAADRFYFRPDSMDTYALVHISHTAYSMARLTSQCHSCLETLPQSARRAILSSQFINRAVIFACAQVFLFPCIETGFLEKTLSSFKVTTKLIILEKCRRL